MSDKKLLLKAIQNDIKNIDKCIDMCDSDEGIDNLKSIQIDYLKSIQKELRKQEIEILKRITIDKMLNEKQYE